MRLPSTIGKYRIEEFLGGGMAEVYRAHDTVLDRPVAFKQLSPAGLADAAVRARFLEEAKVGAALAHENIVRTFDYGETAPGETGKPDEYQPYLVLELLKGASLAAHIKAGTLGSMQNRARIALEMARALSYLHGHRILHRDIKPGNIHIGEGTGRVCLIDFGIAKSEGAHLTQTGFVIGTPYYMAPEQLSGTEVGPATDVYAFGLVLFEMLTSRRARPADTVERNLHQILSEPVDYTPLEAPDIPLTLASLVRQATQADPKLRPAGLATVVAELETWLAANAQALPPPPSGNRHRLSFGQTAAMALIAAAIGGLAVGLLGVSVARARLPEPTALLAGLPDDKMVGIPAGDFEFGQQRHKVFLGTFQIDRSEVINEQYARFCHSKNRALPAGYRPDSPGQPVTGITIDDARAYCFAQAKHLPTEMQWERAARGTSGSRFPWGDQADATRANINSEHLVAALSMDEGASAEGVLHMVGNAAEWVDQQRSPSVLALDKFAGLLKPPATDSEPWYIVKGGSFRRSIAESAADLWLPAPGRYAADDVGFRCAR